MKVRITENYTEEPKVIEYDMEVKEIHLAVKASSKMLQEIPNLELVEIVCLDPNDLCKISF